MREFEKELCRCYEIILWCGGYKGERASPAVAERLTELYGKPSRALREKAKRDLRTAFEKFMETI